MRRYRSIRGAMVVTAVVTLGLAGAGPARAAEPAPQPQANQASLIAALRRDLNLSAAEVTQLLARQAPISQLQQAAAQRLGADYAGSWFDRRTGRLVVAATTAERAAQARSIGTDARVVKRSMKTLDGIKTDLDTVTRQDRAKMSAAVSWSVDPERNQVVVTARKGQAKALAPVLARYGDAVHVVESAIQPQVTADRLDGGDPYDNTTQGGRCSVGFNVTRNGVNHFLTAGHCGVAGDTTAQAGVNIGPFTDAFFPNEDDALVRNDNTGFWIQGPWVFAYTGNPNEVFEISGFRDSPDGTAICKSGQTTAVTCGEVTGTDVTVNYVDADGNPIGTVFGLTQHNACVERGDSGGSNISFTTTQNFAEGVTSGASLDEDGNCLEKVGGENVSFHFPVADSIAFYGLTLMTL